MKKDLIYKPVGLVTGAVAGLIAGAAFHHLWRALRHDRDVPRASDEERGWGELLVAAAVQGATFGAVKAALDRAAIQGLRQLTGHRV